jgi:hypothetical protein
VIVKANRKIKPGEGISIKLSIAERTLLLEHTLADPELTDRLRSAAPSRGVCVVSYTIDDLDELLGYVAAEANHVTDKKIQRALDRLFERLQGELDSHDDGLWQGKPPPWIPQPAAKVPGRVMRCSKRRGCPTRG